MILNIQNLVFSKILKSCNKVRCIISTSSLCSSINSYTERTHNCGQLGLDDVGARVNLFGWVKYTRFDNRIIALRDSYGVVQCIVDKDKVKSWMKVPLHSESVLQVSGIVRQRPEGQVNEKMSTGQIEIIAQDLKIISQANRALPILAREVGPLEEYTLPNRYRHRYLDIRRSPMQHALRFRSKVCRILRQKLYDLNFVECETPTLYNRTPGGANEFIVPTQEPNKFYSLAQSPQQMKQLLMIGGLDRYFQICRCYRDESGRVDRQPEFTQLDIELSFTNRDLIMSLVEGLILYLLHNLSDDFHFTKILTSSFDDKEQIKKMTYHQAIDKYGTDKPDTRFDWCIQDNNVDFLYIDVPRKINGECMTSIFENARLRLNMEHGAPNITFEQITQHEMSFTRVKTFQRSEKAKKLLGAVRLAIAKELVDQGDDIYEKKFEFVWVTDFPLFSVDDQGKLEPNHHPFTAPTEDSIDQLEQNPFIVKGQHYDLVLNGQEIAGGSIRIHDADLQQRIFGEFLKIDGSRFDYFIEALKSGCPPHGGIAFGLDRLVAILLNKNSIRDVIAFPKTTGGKDPLSGCPEELSAEVKNLYHLK